MILSIIGSIGAILIVILIHEAGHFVVARAVGIHVERFSIGFGRALYKWRGKTGTEYIIALLPLGGYVKMRGDGSNAASKSDPTAYANKPVLARMAVVLAGPIANFILAIIIYMGIYTAGVDHLRPIIGAVRPASIAAKAGFAPQQQLISVDGADARSWQRVLMAMILRYGGQGNMQFVVRPKAGAVTTIAVPVARWQFDMLHPDPFSSLGFTPYAPPIPPVIASVKTASVAAKAGLQAGDRIVVVGTKSIKDWSQMSSIISKSPNQALDLQIVRNGKRIHKTVILGHDVVQGKRVGVLGVMAEIPPLPNNLKNTTHEPLWLAWRPALEQCGLLLHFNAVSVWKLIIGDMPLKALGGPITIFHTAGIAATSGIMAYSGFVAFISLMIGFINILPIPALDGGHFFFQIIEAIFGKPVPEWLQRYAIVVGLTALLLLLLQATYNDLLRLF